MTESGWQDIGKRDYWTVRLGRVTAYGGDAYWRPSLWIALRRSQVVLFFGWQWPSVRWLR